MLLQVFKKLLAKRSLRRWAAKVARGLKRQASRAELLLLAATDKVAGTETAAALTRHEDAVAAAAAAPAVTPCYCERLRASGYDMSKLFSLWAARVVDRPQFDITIERVAHNMICTDKVDLYPATRDFLTHVLLDVPRALKPLKDLDAYDDANHEQKYRVGADRRMKLDFEEWTGESRDAFYMRDQIEKLQTVLEMRLKSMQHSWRPRRLDTYGNRWQTYGCEPQPSGDETDAAFERNEDIAWIVHLVCKIADYRKQINV